MKPLAEFRSLRVLSAYTEIFNGDPWYDGWNPLSAWSYLRKDLRNDQLSFFSKGGFLPYAFAWGYVKSVDQLVREKYTSGARTQVLDALQEGGIGLDQNTFYVSEVGVRESYRGRGIGRQFVTKLLNRASQQGYVPVLRTLGGTTMERIALQQGLRKLENLSDADNPRRVLFIR